MNIIVDDVSEVEGCAGASRLVCKSEWDYKFILKFEDLQSLQSYMEHDHERIMAAHMPKIKGFAEGGKVTEQNFVCACHPSPPARCSTAWRLAHSMRARDGRADDDIE